jgi:hypothetical protein
MKTEDSAAESVAVGTFGLCTPGRHGVERLSAAESAGIAGSELQPGKERSASGRNCSLAEEEEMSTRFVLEALLVDRIGKLRERGRELGEL